MTVMPPAGPMPNAANPELACCMYGWDAPNYAGSGRLDCTETPKPTHAVVADRIDTFEKLYNFVNCPNSGAGNCMSGNSSGVNRPYRVFLRDTITQTPIPGFYDPVTGMRCNYLSGTTPTTLSINTQFQLFDTAMSTGVLPAQVPPRCTRLMRVAMEVTCPATNPALWLWRAVDPLGRVRCTAASRITFHIAVNDLAPTNEAKRPRFRMVTSFDPTGSQGGQNFDFFKMEGIQYFKVLRLHQPFGAMVPPQCPQATGFDYSAGEDRCYLK